MSRSIRSMSPLVVGPLAPYADEFNEVLVAQGYAPSTRVGFLQVMVHLSRWLQERGLGVGDVSAEVAEEYLAWRRERGYSSFRTWRRLQPLLGVLAAHGARAERPSADVSDTGADVLLVGYERFLRQERGLAPATVEAYVRRARDFLADHDLSAVSAAEVSDAVLDVAQRRSVSAAQMFVQAVRWLLRYAYMIEVSTADLSTAALPVTGRPSSWLPRGLDQQQVQALLAGCGRDTATGRRDYAVLLVLLRLGLRASEVAGLCLEDLDWRAGLVTVRGKGQRTDGLPIPADVGAAIVEYLRSGRPQVTFREVFVSARAPRRALTRTGVWWIVRAACTRAGIDPVGAHRLRHTAACQLLASGAPLEEIGALLRQRSPVAVSTYARVDVDRLRALCLPWPGQRHGDGDLR